ncbi:MAG: hypothetical protein JXQ29_08130 [Planctomycetes bacterium]|nr:hypothetical protein [Planctomycetota bacterium]
MSDHNKSMHPHTDPAAEDLDERARLSDAMPPDELADPDEILILEQDADLQYSDEGEVLVSARELEAGCEVQAMRGDAPDAVPVAGSAPTHRPVQAARRPGPATASPPARQTLVVKMPRRSRARLLVYAATVLVAAMAGATYYYTLHPEHVPWTSPTKSATTARMKPPPRPAPLTPAEMPDPAAAEEPEPDPFGSEPVPEDPVPPPDAGLPGEVDTPPPLEDPVRRENGRRPGPATTAQSLQALQELVNMQLVEGFARLEPASGGMTPGITVRLRDGKEVVLAPGESLVELRNGNHFRGDIVTVGEESLTMAFPYGTIRIPRQDLNQVLPPGTGGDLPLDQYRTGIVRLRNGNRLSGKIVTVTDDRVVLGFPSAQIVVPRTVMAETDDALEYTEADTPRYYFGTARAGTAAAPGAGLPAEGFLGVPYYDFVNGFSFVPPRGWQRFTKDAILGFHAPPESPRPASLNLGGLYLDEGALPGGLETLRDSLPNALANLQVLGGVQRTTTPEHTWNFVIECLVVGAESTEAAAERRSHAKRARIYVFSRAHRVFLMSAFAMERDFDQIVAGFDQCAKTFDYKN